MNQIKLNSRNSWRPLLVVTALALLVTSIVGATAVAQDEEKEALPNIVLVHGAWADGSSWSGVIKGLQADGSNVITPPSKPTSPASIKSWTP
jgi:hypothetical protein